MRRFILGGDSAYADLERRARRACVVFGDCELPPSSYPARARVGFEVHASGEALLFVDRGVTCPAADPEVQAWLAEGQRRFASFAELVRWLRHDLAAAFAISSPPRRITPSSPPGSPASSPPSRPLAPAALIDLDAVAATAADLAPPAYLNEGEVLTELRARVFGQDGALELLARRICRHLARRQPRRPATIFAVGPTGVGKTRTAEALAEALGTLLPGQWHALRLNMSEYQERHRISQLIGAPPSYVGYGDGAELTDALVAYPETVVLFDEIEKAHPDVLRALMNAMDAGELSASAPSREGRRLDCRRAVFFFTSNLDATEILRDLAGDDHATNLADAERVCRRRLRAAGLGPELIGRVSTFLVFRPLSQRARAEIATAAVVRVADEYGLTVARIEPGVINAVLSSSPDGLGARPDEYRVDELLGQAFARAAAQQDAAEASLVVRAGPPFHCEMERQEPLLDPLLELGPGQNPNHPPQIATC